jgi:hypothetical protein
MVVERFHHSTKGIPLQAEKHCSPCALSAFSFHRWVGNGAITPYRRLLKRALQSGGTEAVSIRVWDQQANAEASARSTSPHVLKAVVQVVEGTPQVDRYAVSHATFPTIAARVAV